MKDVFAPVMICNTATPVSREAAQIHFFNESNR